MTSKLHTIFIRLFFILIFISATSVAYLLLPNEPTPHPRPPLFEKGREDHATTTLAVILRPQAEESLKFDNTDNDSVKGSFVVAQDDKPTTAITTATTATATENFQTATLTINEQNYTLQFNSGENLLTAMRRLMDTSAGQFSFSGHDYAGIGFFVEEINGLKNSSSDQMYWIYHLNSQTAKVGISGYLLKSGDIIKWQYEKNKY